MTCIILGTSVGGCVDYVSCVRGNPYHFCAG